MPGITGYCHQSQASWEGLTAMIRPMLHRPDYDVRKYEEDFFKCATIDLKQGIQHDCARSGDGRYFLVLFGFLYEEWSFCSSPARQLMQRWIEKGWRGLADLNGEYVIVVWDKIKRELTVVNDRLGLKRLQYRIGKNDIAFASELKSLAILPDLKREINEEALAELLIFGHLQDDRTLLKGVKLLPAASCLIWREGAFSLETYWDYEYRADPQYENSETAIDDYYCYVRNAVEKRLKRFKKPGIFLSGGYDSRTLAGMIRKAQPDAHLLSWTAGHGHDHDTRYAKRIAKAVRSRHQSINIPENFLDLYGPEYAWALDGMASTHGSHRACLMGDTSAEAEAIFIGYMGDTVSGGKPLDKFHEVTDLDYLIDAGFRYYEAGFTDELLRSTLNPAVYERIQGRAKQAFAASVRKAHVEFLPDSVVYAELVQRQRLWNPPAQMDLMGLDQYVMLPFADKDFIDYSLRLPWKQRVHKEAYKGMIRKYLPKFAKIPRSGEGLPLFPSRLRAAWTWRWLKFQQRDLPRWTGGRLGHNYQTFVHCEDWFRNASARFIRENLVDSEALSEHFEPKRLNELVGLFFKSGPTRLMDCVAALISYALFRKNLQQVAPLPDNRKWRLNRKLRRTTEVTS